MAILPTHPSKAVTVEHNGSTYARHMVKTERFDKGSNVVAEIISATNEFIEDEDIICIAESVIAITQGRAYKINEIQPGFTARTLSKFVTRTPAGIGLGIPETMQLAVQEVGAWRLWLAAGIAAITKQLGRKGDFYRIAGARARGIDGPTSGTLPPYNTYASLIPLHPKKTAQHIKTMLEHELNLSNLQVIIVDANDIGVNILGACNKKQELLAKSLVGDNPMGQGHEQTPVMVCRITH